jgi:hypothetical protein
MLTTSARLWTTPGTEQNCKEPRHATLPERLGVGFLCTMIGEARGAGRLAIWRLDRKQKGRGLKGPRNQADVCRRQLVLPVCNLPGTIGAVALLRSCRDSKFQNRADTPA